MNAAIDRKSPSIWLSMDEADREEPKAASAQADGRRRLAALKAKGPAQSQAEEWRRAAASQLLDRTGGETDADATWACGPYNAQTAVDAKHKLIVAFELTNEGTTATLYPMAAQGKDAVGGDQ